MSIWVILQQTITETTADFAAIGLYVQSDSMLALCEVNPLGIRGFPSRRVSNVETWCFLWYMSENYKTDSVAAGVLTSQRARGTLL